MMSRRQRLLAGGWVLLALILVPLPLVPPHALGETVQSIFKISWKPAYLVTVLGLQVVFYAPLGVLAACLVGPVDSVRGRLLRALAVSAGLVVVALLIWTLRQGYWPVLANMALPALSCVAGVGVGTMLHYFRLRTTVWVSIGTMLLLGGIFWGVFGSVSSELAGRTKVQLERMVEAGPGLPWSGKRFGTLVEVAFSAEGEVEDPILHNRAAILALGIAVGHESLARFIGLDGDSELVQKVARLRRGANIRGRGDWSRHFCLSAGLVVLENPFLSDAGGVMKEQVDVQASGSGFSFTDLAADRAGMRFAEVATRSVASARGLAERLEAGFVLDEFFPSMDELPDSLSMREFNTRFGGVGSREYRDLVKEIDRRLDGCVGFQREP